ncbi:MAG: hypothetical protein QOJ29_1708, partial [Thermoleophilaceae bacterium]|nr:hypothetical protein [Thermoleophilaceae bacterium]
IGVPVGDRHGPRARNRYLAGEALRL